MSCQTGTFVPNFMHAPGAAGDGSLDTFVALPHR
jgi:hypothetical protein